MLRKILWRFMPVFLLFICLPVFGCKNKPAETTQSTSVPVSANQSVSKPTPKPIEVPQAKAPDMPAAPPPPSEWSGYIVICGMIGQTMNPEEVLSKMKGVKGTEPIVIDTEDYQGLPKERKLLIAGRFSTKWKARDAYLDLKKAGVPCYFRSASAKE